MDDCIFCKIAAGEMGELIYENELACAFYDLNPQAPFHALVIPKAHHAHVLDGVSADTLAAMLEVVNEITRSQGIFEGGFRIIMNTGADAGQTVHHLHMHVLGGKSLGEGLLP